MPGIGTTHHVRIGTHYYLVQPGSYRKRPAPLFGPRFTTGDPDYNNLTSWQHWVQSCWVGGFGAEDWTDDSMYDDAAGVDGSQHEVLVLARDLGPAALATRTGAGNWDLSGTAVQREFTTFNGKLYVLEYTTATNCKMWRYNDGTDDWTLVRTFTEAIHAACEFGGYLYFGSGGATISRMDTAEAFTTVAKPAGRTETPWALMVFRDRMYAGFGRFIWRMKSDGTWDGSTTFYEAVGVDTIDVMENHLGFLYFGSKNGHILRTDGNATFDLWQFDPGVWVTAMRSYDGRLFVMTREEEIGSTAGAGVLYQFTGSAVTELKRWGIIGNVTYTHRLRVIFRKLFFGASNLLGYTPGFGIATYDSLEDAYQIWSTSRDGTNYPAGSNGVNHIVDDVVYWKGYVFAAVRGTGAWKTKLTFKDVSRYQATYDTTANGANPGSNNGGWLRSSDYDAGTPGLVKYWRQITIHADLPTTACTVYVEVSGDGGATWSALGTVSKTSAATRYRTSFFINIRSTRLKYRITLRTTDSTRSPQVRAVVVSYLPMPDPTWMWEMTLVCAEKLHLLDGTTDETVDPEVEAAYLEGLFRSGTPVKFYDIDGTEWSPGFNGVIMTDIQKDVGHIAANDEGGVESRVRVTLMESTESHVDLI